MAGISGFGQTGPMRSARGSTRSPRDGRADDDHRHPRSGARCARHSDRRICAPVYCSRRDIDGNCSTARSRRGQWVHTSCSKRRSSLLDFQRPAGCQAGEVAKQAGNDIRPASQPGCPDCDGQINIAASGDNLYKRFCEAAEVTTSWPIPIMRPARRARKTASGSTRWLAKSPRNGRAPIGSSS